MPRYGVRYPEDDVLGSEDIRLRKEAEAKAARMNAANIQERRLRTYEENQARIAQRQAEQDRFNADEDRKKSEAEEAEFVAMFGKPKSQIMGELISSTTGFSKPTQNYVDFKRREMQTKLEGKPPRQGVDRSGDTREAALAFIQSWKPGQMTEDMDEEGNKIYRPATGDDIVRTVAVKYPRVKIMSDPDIRAALDAFNAPDPGPPEPKRAGFWNTIKNTARRATERIPGMGPSAPAASNPPATTPAPAGEEKVVVQDKDGKRFRLPVAQLKDAEAQGYKQVR